MITFKCICGKVMAVDELVAGKVWQCPECRNKMPIPMPEDGVSAEKQKLHLGEGVSEVFGRGWGTPLDVQCQRCGSRFMKMNWVMGMRCPACNSVRFFPADSEGMQVDVFGQGGDEEAAGRRQKRLQEEGERRRQRLTTAVAAVALLSSVLFVLHRFAARDEVSRYSVEAVCVKCKWKYRAKFERPAMDCPKCQRPFGYVALKCAKCGLEFPATIPEGYQRMVCINPRCRSCAFDYTKPVDTVAPH